MIEHGSTRSGRWLRERRLRITLWIAAVEGLLYIAHVLHWWEAVRLAVIGVGLWWLVGRNSRSDLSRQRDLDPRRVAAARTLRADRARDLKAFAIGIIAVLAIVGLVLLFTRKPA